MKRSDIYPRRQPAKRREGSASVLAHSGRTRRHGQRVAAPRIARRKQFDTKARKSLGNLPAEASCVGARGKDFLNALGLSSSPRQPLARRLAVLPKTVETSAACAARQTVLVVDDDESMRTLLRRMLERRGFTVVTAINGQDGMERFLEQPVDIVVT